jgi:hypothetical protein
VKYLGKAPFSSKPATDNYRKGWEALFGKPKRHSKNAKRD